LTQPITFTGVVAIPGSWAGLSADNTVITPALVNLSYVTLDYGGVGSAGAQVYADRAVVTITHSLVRNGAGNGLYLSYRVGGFNLQTASFISNSLNAIRLDAPTIDLLMNDLSASNNGTNGVYIVNVSTYVHGQHRWANPGIPYVINDQIINQPGDELTIDPGSVLQFVSNTSLNIGGQLKAIGLPDQPITLTAQAQTPGGWRGIVIDGGTGNAVAQLDYATVEYGGGDIGGANIEVSNGQLIAHHSNIRQSSKDGVRLDSNATVSVLNSQIVSNTLYGVTNVAPANNNPILATNDWWGDPNGPKSDLSTCSSGNGDKVTVALSADFMPIVSGHYCVQVSYNITAVGSAHVLRPQAGGGSELKQFNLNAQPAPTLSPNSKDSLDKADKSWNKVEKLAPKGTNIQTGILDAWWGWVKDTATKWSQSLGFDPLRQDYNQTTLPVWHNWPPVQPDANISAARAAAHNAVSAALADVNAYGTAAALALDRYSGASEADDLEWAAQQANAQLYYQQKLGGALLTYADKLDAFVQVLSLENATDITMTVGDIISYQQRLATTGFTPQEIANAKLVGLTDADIEAYRQETIAADPNDIAGNLMDIYTSEAAVSRELGNVLLHPYSYAPGLVVSGGAGALIAATNVTSSTANGNTLAQINNTVETIPLGNSLAQTTTINIRARRVDLPANWAVDVSPAQVTLAPSQLITVTASVLAGSLVPQGSIPRVAIEGYAGSQLLGGVVIDVVVPKYVPFVPWRVYLPLILR